MYNSYWSKWKCTAATGPHGLITCLRESRLIKRKEEKEKENDPKENQSLMEGENLKTNIRKYEN